MRERIISIAHAAMYATIKAASRTFTAPTLRRAERHGLFVERRVDGPSHYKAAMSLDLDSPTQVADALLMRFTKNS